MGRNQFYLTLEGPQMGYFVHLTSSFRACPAGHRESELLQPYRNLRDPDMSYMFRPLDVAAVG